MNRAALPVRVYALSAGSAPPGTAWFLGATLQAPLFSLSWPRFPLSGRVPAAKRRLYQGPPRATKVQQLLIFGIPPSPSEADQPGGGLLPMSVRQGRPARFSPDFRASARKRDRRGLARGISTF